MSALVRYAAVAAWRCQFVLTRTARVWSERQDFLALSEEEKSLAIARRLRRLLARIMQEI